MSDWERKRKELHGKLVRQSNFALVAMVTMATMMVFGLVKIHGKEEQKLLEQDYKQLQEMRHQYNQRQR